MTKDVNKNLVLFAEYKEGFEKIKLMVDGFKDINPDSQQTFINERILIFRHQLEALKEKENEVFIEVRSFLAKANSKLKALSDMEAYIFEQIGECNEIKDIIQTDKAEKNVV